MLENSEEAEIFYLNSFILYAIYASFDEGILPQKGVVNQFRPKCLAEVEWA